MTLALARRQLPFLEAGFGLFEPSHTVEVQYVRLVRSCHEHGFVAACGPRGFACCVQDLLAKTAPPEIGMGHDIFDQRIGFAAARKVGHDDECARDGKMIVHNPDQYVAAGVQAKAFEIG